MTIRWQRLPFCGQSLAVHVEYRPGSDRISVKGFIPEDPSAQREGEIRICTGTEDREVIRRALEQWYRKQAKAYIQNTVDYYAEQMGVSYNRIAIKDTISRWGSCSSLKNLNFSYRIVMMPPAVAEYVVIHEVTHLKHMDHSGEFWKDVAAYCPEYKARIRWLKENGLYYMKQLRPDCRQR